MGLQAMIIFLGPNAQLAMMVIVTVTGLLLAPYLFQDSESVLCMKTCQARRAEEAATTESTFAIYDKIFIAIRTSKACEISGTCPSYNELAIMFDNSNKYLSGDFFFNNETKRWDREPPIIHNSFELYKITDKPTPVVIWVNPDDYTWDRTKQIMIESEYYRPMKNMPLEDNIIYAYEGRQIEECHRAVIGWTTVNGSALLTDTLNYFMSNCKEPLEIDEIQEIFLNSTIFPDCDKDCFHLRYLFKQEMKAFHQVEKEFEEKYTDEDSDDFEDRPETLKEKYEERLNKEERRLERMQELEDIQECERFKRHEASSGTGRVKVDCIDEEEREEYLEEEHIEHPDGIKSVSKFRGNYTR
jgi:hypothetical protein